MRVHTVKNWSLGVWVIIRQIKHFFWGGGRGGGTVSALLKEFAHKQIIFLTAMKIIGIRENLDEVDVGNDFSFSPSQNIRIRIVSLETSTAHKVTLLHVSILGFHMTPSKIWLCKLWLISPKFCYGLWDQIKCLRTKSEVIWTTENRVMSLRSWRIFYYVIWENGLVGILLPTNKAAAI